MSLQQSFEELRREARACDAELEAKIEKRLALIELRQRQIHTRIRLLELHWGINWDDGIDMSRRPSEYRSQQRRAKIPQRPRLMALAGVGVDPPKGDREWALML